jgi:hypothetical protein
VGIRSISEAARQLEDAGKTGDLDFIDRQTPLLLADLDTMLGDISRTLAEHFQGASAGSPSAEPGDNNTVLGALDRLIEGLDNFDIGTVNEIMSGLKKVFRNTPKSPLLDEIAGFILVADYDDAIYKVKELKEAL